MPRKSKGYEVHVEYKGTKYRLPGLAPDKATAEKHKDLLVLLLTRIGVFSQSGRVPTIQHPKQNYYMPEIPVEVVNVTTDLRSRLAAAMQVCRHMLPSTTDPCCLWVTSNCMQQPA